VFDLLQCDIRAVDDVLRARFPPDVPDVLDVLDAPDAPDAPDALDAQVFGPNLAEGCHGCRHQLELLSNAVHSFFGMQDASVADYG